MSGAGISTRQEDKSGSVSSLYGLSEYQASLARRARVEQRAKENHIAYEEEKKSASEGKTYKKQRSQRTLMQHPEYRRLHREMNSNLHWKNFKNRRQFLPKKILSSMDSRQKKKRSAATHL